MKKEKRKNHEKMKKRKIIKKKKKKKKRKGEFAFSSLYYPMLINLFLSFIFYYYQYCFNYLKKNDDEHATCKLRFCSLQGGALSSPLAANFGEYS